jgi:hypothetical protein
MGSYAQCWLGSLYVGSSKNDVDHGIMQLFRPSDKRTLPARSVDLPPQLKDWTNDLEDDDANVVFYTTPAAVVQDRLELLGYTLDTAKSAFAMSMGVDAANHAEWSRGPHGELFKEESRLLEELTVDVWLDALRTIKSKSLKQRARGGDVEGVEDPVLRFMLTHDWYGYSGPDLNVGLRLALEACGCGDDFVYDLTDLVLGGDFSTDEDLVAYSMALTANEYASSGKVIVLTEGRSDARILAESLALLYPHLADYFSFMDFEGVRIGGGAGSLVNIVKAFAGAGIVNRTVALFDNDTAARAALAGLRSIRLPSNIVVKRLPRLAELEQYPTIGPTGSALMNVNDVAGGLELYLGSDVLTEPSGTPMPVQWTGYDVGVGEYQGELVSKAQAQDRFWAQLNACQTNPSLVATTDWRGLRAILGELFTAFRNLNRDQILAGLDHYYGDRD